MEIGKSFIKKRVTTIVLVVSIVLVLIIAAAFGTGAVRRISSKSDAPSSVVSDTSGIEQPPGTSSMPSNTAALGTDVSSSSTAFKSSDPSDPLKSILAKYTTDTVTFFQSFTTDRNQKAAFAVTGYVVWYVDASGAQKLGRVSGSMDNEPYYAPVIWTVGNTKIFKGEEVPGGSSTISHAWYVKDGKPVKLSNTGMDLSYLGSGQFTTEGEAFDKLTSNGSEAGGHTYKLYYLYWANDGLKEYGGLKITKQQLLKMKGAQAILNAITESGHTVDDIYYRADNIININYHSGDRQECNNDNVTLVYKNNAVTPKLARYTDQGSSKTESLNKDNLSDFSYGGIYKAAFFPEIATYPDKFPMK